MRYFIESSVLIAAAIGTHENNKAAVNLLLDCKAEGELMCLSTHVLAEMYATITKLGRREQSPYLPLGAVQLIRQTVAEMTTVVLVEEDYYRAMNRCVRQGLTGAVVYDALHYEAALKSNCDILYTDNLRDFTRLGDDELLQVSGIR